MAENCVHCGHFIPVANMNLHLLHCLPQPPQVESRHQWQDRYYSDRPADAPVTVGADPEWACEQCTFLNRQEDNTCDMCSGPRPSHPNPQAPQSYQNLAEETPQQEQGRPAISVRVIERSFGPGGAYVRVTRRDGTATHTTTTDTDTREQTQREHMAPHGVIPRADGMYGGAVRGGLGGALLSGALAAMSGRNVGQAVWNGALYGAVVGGAVNEVGGMMNMDLGGPATATAGPGSGGAGVERGTRGPVGGAESVARQMFGGFGMGEPSYEQLMQMFGPPERPRANPTRVADLPTHRIETEEEADRLPEERSTCSVCMEKFGAGDTTKSMPCFHSFHEECIDRWLARANTCPICTQPLPA